MLDFPDATPWSRVTSETGPDLKLFRARFDQMQNPRNGHLERMVVLESPHAAQIVAQTSEGELLFVYQFRFGIGAFTLELPGGIVEPGEAPQLAAQRELAEETAYAGGKWTQLGANPANPVFQDSLIYTFQANGVLPIAKVEQDPGEDVRLIKLARSEALEYLLAGQFQHPHTVVGLMRYFAADLSERVPHPPE